MFDSFDEYKFSVHTIFDKKHIIFGGMDEVETWCSEKFGPGSHIKVVSVNNDWQLTFKFKSEEHAILFTLMWS